MRWNEDHESPDVIDRRGDGGGGGGAGGSGALFALLPLLVRSPLGIVILVVIVGVSVASRFFASAPDAPRVSQATTQAAAADAPARFVGFVLDDTQANWAQVFARQGKSYRHAKLVLFDGSTSTACGYGESATGPFYCPSDERVYIDLAFFTELSRRLGAQGDFAQAYVIAHEVGHHVQKLLGASGATRNLKQGEREGANSASVRLELQADCYAGIWAASAQSRGLLETGDVGEALGAASAVGDDRLQRRATGVVTPDTFTHGTAAQRTRWFRTGFDRGELSACDTFATSAL